MKDITRHTSLFALVAILCLPGFGLAEDDPIEWAVPEHAILSSKFMIGIVGQRNQDGKLAVHQVAEGSPAEKAGVQADDIIVRFGKTSVKDILELSRAVDAAGETESEIRVLRDGKKVTLKITPTKRPQPAAPAIPPASRYTIFYPGMLFPGAQKLPKGVEVRIVGQGDKPAKVIITTDKDKWEVAANELAKLPKEAKSAIGLGGTIAVPLNAWPTLPPGAAPAVVPPPIRWVPAKPKYIPLPPTVEKVETKFEKLERQMKVLQDAVKELQHQHEHK